MENNKSQILFKIIWIGVILFTVYIFGGITLVQLTFGNIFTEEYNTWNLLIPNIFSIGLLVIYTKEILIGYKPKTKKWNLISLLLYSTLIIILSIVQIPQFEILFDGLESEPWQIIISLIIILSSYIGIIMNRILIIKELDNTK